MVSCRLGSIFVSWRPSTHSQYSIVHSNGQSIGRPLVHYWWTPPHRLTGSLAHWLIGLFVQVGQEEEESLQMEKETKIVTRPVRKRWREQSKQSRVDRSEEAEVYRSSSTIYTCLYIVMSLAVYVHNFYDNANDDGHAFPFWLAPPPPVTPFTIHKFIVLTPLL